MRTRAAEASNELRNAALDVLRGERSGRVYKKPSTYGKRMNKHTKKLYGHKLRGGQLYQASVPGEPPAERANTLRRSFEEKIAAENKAAYKEVKAYIETKQEYVAALDEGTDTMASRPIREPVIDRAKPRIRQIFSKPYD